MSRLAALAIMAATSLCFVEGCMFGCDANGIDDKPVALKAQKLEANVTCGEAPALHLHAADDKGNSLTFDASGDLHEGDVLSLSAEASTAASRDRVVQSSQGPKARMAIHAADGADAVDSTDITSATVEIESLPAGDKPFTIRVRVGFVDGATLDEEYRATATEDATCETP